MIYTAKSEDTIFDVALLAYQDASRVLDILLNNPQIDNVNSDLTGVSITYIPEVITTKESIKTASILPKNVTISFDQSVFDIALQYYGGVENVFKFIVENGIDNINSDITGLKLKYTQNNTYIPLYFRINNKNIATKYPT
jgi:hypothetical protein